MPDLYLATHPDGSQTLVTLWGDGSDDAELGEVAFRPTSHDAWGVPTPLAVSA